MTRAQQLQRPVTSDQSPVTMSVWPCVLILLLPALPQAAFSPFPLFRTVVSPYHTFVSPYDTYPTANATMGRLGMANKRNFNTMRLKVPPCPKVWMKGPPSPEVRMKGPPSPKVWIKGPPSPEAERRSIQWPRASRRSSSSRLDLTFKNLQR